MNKNIIINQKILTFLLSLDVIEPKFKNDDVLTFKVPTEKAFKQIKESDTIAAFCADADIDVAIYGELGDDLTTVEFTFKKVQDIINIIV